MAGKRRSAREMAVQMLYQGDLGGTDPREIFASFNLAEYLAAELPSRNSGVPAKANPGLAQEAFDYAKNLVEGTLEHCDQIDDLIRLQADNWRLERMPAVDRNILRLAIFEMLYEQDVPKLVIVDEAIELAKKYGSEQSGRFVNGLLDGLLKKEKFPGRMT